MESHTASKQNKKSP